MSYEKRCENCIWFDKCHGEEVCDDYFSTSPEIEEATRIVEYEEILRERQSGYRKLVDEQDS